MAGANSIFTGDTLLTTPNNEKNEDDRMFEELGLVGRPAFMPYSSGGPSSNEEAFGGAAGGHAGHAQHEQHSRQAAAAYAAAAAAAAPAAEGAQLKAGGGSCGCGKGACM